MEHSAILAKQLISIACSVLLVGASQAASQPLPPIKGVVMMTVAQTRPDQVGDRYSYVADTHSRVSRDGVTHESDQHQAFDIEIVKVDKDGMVVRLVRTEVSAKPSAPDTPGDMQTASWTGVPVEFKTNSNGFPLGIVDEDHVKAQLVAHFSSLSPTGLAKASTFKQWLDALPEDAFFQLAADKLTMMAAMQPRGPIPMGHKDLPSETQKDADGTAVQVKHTAEISIAQGAPCQVWIQRSTWTERPGGARAPSSSLNTEATLSENDGWVVNLTETSKATFPSVEQIRTVKISRQQNGGCPK